MSGEEGCDDVCGCRMSGELNGVRNGRRRGIVETTRVQAVDLEKRPLDDDGDVEHKARMKSKSQLDGFLMAGGVVSTGGLVWSKQLADKVDMEDLRQGL
jgi:hypothetical protein